VSVAVVWVLSDDELGSWVGLASSARLQLLGASEVVQGLKWASPAAAQPPQVYAVAQVPFSRTSPRLRSRLRLIPAARVAHQALFLTTPR